MGQDENNDNQNPRAVRNPYSSPRELAWDGPSIGTILGALSLSLPWWSWGSPELFCRFCHNIHNQGMGLDVPLKKGCT